MLDNITFICFTEMNLEEKKLVLSWRNHRNIKKWMYDKKDISLQNHLKFINTLKDNNSKKYMLVKNDDLYVGVIDFIDIDFIKKECEFGLYANPNLKGLGSSLMQVIVYYAFNILKINLLKAEVFINNLKAINLYQRYGFKEINKKVINNQEVICMELKNENWKI